MINHPDTLKMVSNGGAETSVSYVSSKPQPNSPARNNIKSVGTTIKGLEILVNILLLYFGTHLIKNK